MAQGNMIQLIKELRDRTGAGMMDCKRALEANDLDAEKAIEWLREKGIAKAAAKASRIAAEGLTGVMVSANSACIVEVNCETDFVAKGDRFHSLVNDVLKTTLESKPSSIELAVEQTAPLFTDATVAMGEKLSYRRFELVEKTQEGCFGSYLHMGGKIGVLVVLSKDDAELAKGLAMHIAANNPTYIATEDIPASVIEKEKQIAFEAAKTDEKLANKPENILKGIIEGKVNKMLAESTLSKQVYLLDGESNIGKMLESKGVKIVKFVRYSVGEGIAKRVDNFAEEVMASVK